MSRLLSFFFSYWVISAQQTEATDVQPRPSAISESVYCVAADEKPFVEGSFCDGVRGEKDVNLGLRHKYSVLLMHVHLLH